MTPTPEKKTENGIVVKGLGGLYEVETESGRRIECRGRGVFRHEKLTLIPGDRVSVLYGSGGEVIDRAYPRKTSLIRPAIANLDLLYLLIPTASPAPSLSTCDKLICICEHNGIDVKIIVSKADLDPSYAEVIADIYKKSGFDVMISGEGYDKNALKRFVFENSDGKISAFSGASGVGKSTLMNHLFPSLGLETGEISRKVERGKHTTRKAELYGLSGLTNGELRGYLADTPGFSMLDFERFDFFALEDLFYAFREFVPYENRCRYTKCTHTKEEGCAILERVKSGEIPKSRHDSYLEIYETLKNKHAWDRKNAPKPPAASPDKTR